MEKLVFVILSIAAVTSAEVSVTCSEQFIAQHGPIFPVSGSCEKYLVCSGGQMVEQTCQSGLYFSVEFSECVPERVAKCSSVHRQIIDDRKCNDPDEVSFHPDPHHCARYVLCLGNTTIPRVCAAGLLFNSGTGRCDFPQNVFCDVACPSDGNDLVFIGDSTGRDCARYSICLNGVPRSARCSSMLYFDIVTGTCMQPEVAACRVRDVHCTTQDKLIADPENCSSYYQCEGGLPHYRECEKEQIFSDGRCVPGYCGDVEGTTEGGASTVSSTAVATESSTPYTTSEMTTDLETSTIIGTTTSDAASTVVTVTSTIVTSEVTSNSSTQLHTSTVPITSTSTQPVTPSTITTSATTPDTIPEVTSTTQTESSSTMTTDVTTESNTSTDSSSTETISITSAITPESTTPVHTDNPSTPNTESSTLTSPIITETPMTTTALTTDSSTPTQTGNPPTTGSTISTPAEPPSTDPAVVCHGTGIALFPHPYRCDQYFVCIFGSGSLATCDGGLLFDRKSMVCVPADRVAC